MYCKHIVEVYSLCRRYS